MERNISPCLLFILLLPLCLCGRHACAQGQTSFNLTTGNGLPSNSVYSFITDRLGYLWICTDQGVVKYNGYECKLFSMSEGLPSDDVWGAVEDQKGRIWLSSISNELGYIYDNRYVRANLKNIKGTIFPFFMKRWDSGVVFTSFYISGTTLNSICIERNDTVYPFVVKSGLLKESGIADTSAVPAIHVGSEKNIYSYMGRHYYAIKNLDSITVNKPQKVFTEKLFVSDSLARLMGENGSFCLGGYFISHPTGGTSHVFQITDAKTGRIRNMDLRDLGINEKIEYGGFDNSINNDHYVYTYTKNHVVKYDISDGPTYLFTYNIGTSLDNAAGKKRISGYSDNTLWDTCVSTTAHGMFLLGGNMKFTKLPGNDLEGFRCVGMKRNDITAWWSTDLRKLLLLKNNVITHEYHLPTTHQVNSVLPIGTDSLLVTGSENYYIDIKKRSIRHEEAEIFIKNIISIIKDPQGGFFIAARPGVYHTGTSFIRKGWLPDFIDIDRYDDAVYDESRKTFWAYNHNKILLYKNKKKSIINNTYFPKIGLDKIEKICIDRYFGNVFIKNMSSLMIYDYEQNNSREILPNINIKNAKLEINDNKLVIYGDFGVLFARILGKGKISAPQIMHNTKKIHYGKYFSHIFINDKMLLQTDKGLYEILVPADSTFKETTAIDPGFNYHLVVDYGNALRLAHTGDTLLIDQNNRSLQMDIINPMGSGKPVFHYKLQNDSSWHTTSSGEITIPSRYVPDGSYKLRIYCSDDAWKTNTVELNIHISAYWWQKKSAKGLLWIGISLLSVSVIFLSVSMTRRAVLAATQKKQMRMELELKAIYAQINPHFIFNSLTSALLLISKNKMDDAYAHVSKFSKLLRSYLKSSRNKYITVTEEVENLKNYVELQQSRFKHRFVCNFIIDPGLYNDQYRIPSLLVQPFVENAINHGILYSSKEGKLTIEFRLTTTERKIVCIITDNGIGRRQSKENKKGNENTLGSYGNMMIKDLVRIFDKYEEMRIDIKYEDREVPETGTSVVISIIYPPEKK